MSPQDPTPAFERAFQVILRLEGVGVNPKNPDGYVNHVRDPGGETKFGISKKAFPTVDLAALTRADALAIYWTHYWRPSYADHPARVFRPPPRLNRLRDLRVLAEASPALPPTV